MQFEALEATIDFFCHSQNEVEFIWHGGEPLLAGLDFYNKALEIQHKWEKKGRKIVNFIQTNGTLVTAEWIRFFVDNNFFVGISLDGPKEYHDHFRRYPKGGGSHDDVMRSINLLQETEIFNGIICGVSSINYRFPVELFNFFVSNDIKKLKFSRIREIGHCGDASSQVISPKQYYDFMISVFDCWLRLDDPEVEIRDIQSVVNLILGGHIRECIYMGQCDQFATVYADGSIYCCDSFPRVENFCFGSVFDEPKKIASNTNLRYFQKLLELRKKHCKSCEWYFVCKGGCLREHYEYNNSRVRLMDDVCINLKRYLEHISDKLGFYNLV